MTQPIQLHNWPSVILHLDADAFFASVEQALHPELKGRAVITGAERGIVAAASYEAKRCGVARGIPLGQAKKICPGLICLPSDYETYSIFSKRLFAIMGRFTPTVEEYSIDEGFADLSGLRRLYHTSFPGIAQKIKETVESELGITVSVGLSLSKSLSKLCSKLRKPSGFVAVPGRFIHRLLEITPLEKVWGFGPNTVALLHKQGIRNALDYVKRPEEFAQKLLGKIGLEIHRELEGRVVYPINTQEKTTYVTISKVKTFTPPSAERDFVYAQALKNLEKASMKARRYSLSAKKLFLFLRFQTFEDEGMEMGLARPTASILDLVKPFSQMFDRLYRGGRLYRSTGVVLGDLSVVAQGQLNFFEDPLRVIKSDQVSRAVDEVNTRYGKHKVHLADSLPAHRYQQGQLPSAREFLSERKKNLLPGENFRRRLGIPLLGTAV